MATQTLRQRYAQGLKALGCAQLESKSSKYWKFEHPHRDNPQFIELTKGEPRFVFLGASGAVRVGKSASESVASSPKFIQFILSAQK